MMLDESLDPDAYELNEDRRAPSLQMSNCDEPRVRDENTVMLLDELLDQCLV